MKIWISASLLVSLAILSPLMAQEICDNAIDDDQDGLVDLNDPDCNCNELLDSNIEQSLIYNCSFEDNTCLPNGLGRLDCAKHWQQATKSTTDYINNHSFNPYFPKPLPHGESAVGAIFAPKWQEYVGADLKQPMKVGNDYQLKLHLVSVGRKGPKNCPLAEGDSIRIEVFGTPDLGTLPLPINGKCPENYKNWHSIGSIIYLRSEKWVQYEIPIHLKQDINAIMIGSSCVLPNHYLPIHQTPCYPYFGMDGIVLMENDQFTNSANVIINQSGYSCSKNLILAASTKDSGGHWQWYLEGKALIGQNDSLLNISKSGIKLTTKTKISVRYLKNGICSITSKEISPIKAPKCSFNVTTACESDSVSLKDASTIEQGTIISTVWDFTSDGIVDSKSAKVQFETPITNAIRTTLIATSNVGCSDTASRIYNINSPSRSTQSVITCTPFTWIDGKTYHQNNNTARYTLPNRFGCDSVVTLDLKFDTLTTAIFDWSGRCQGEKITFRDYSKPGLGTVNSWYWSFGDGFTSEIQNSIHSFEDDGIKTVSLAVRTDQGCTDTVHQKIEILPQPIHTVTSVDSACGVVCLNLTFSTKNNLSLADWLWTFPNGDTSKTLTPEFCFTNYSDTTKKYNVILRSTGRNGCQSKALDTTVAYVWPIPKANFSVVNENADLLDPTISFNNTSSNNAVAFAWEFDRIGISNERHPEFRFPDDLSRNYNVRLTAQNDFGCKDNKSLPVRIYDPHNFFIPNTFTPNGDGLNDEFLPVFSGINPNEYSLVILNRWGQTIFTSNSPERGWDGTVKGNIAQPDAYVWVAEIVNERTGIRKKLRGHLTLLK